MQAVCAREELDAGHPGHLLVGDQERHGLLGFRQRPELGQAGRGAIGTDDAGVVSEPPAQISLERPQDGPVG